MNRKTAWRRLVQSEGRTPPQHGTAGAYQNYGCRCHECRAARARYMECYREKHPRKRAPFNPRRPSTRTLRGLFACQALRVRAYLDGASERIRIAHLTNGLTGDGGGVDAFEVRR